MVTRENTPLQTSRFLTQSSTKKCISIGTRPLDIWDWRSWRILKQSVTMLSLKTTSSHQVMLCHRLCVPTANLFSPRRLFDVVDIEDVTDADCTTVEASVCNQSSAAAQLPSSSEQLHSVCKHVLQGVFTEKDLDALSAKATQLIEKDSIRDGFDSQSHFVKSTSSNNPHTVNRLASGMFACGNECLGYKTRKLCSHVIAVAFCENHLTEFLSKFKEGIGKRPQT